MVDELQRIHEARRQMLLAHEILTPLSRLRVRKDPVDDETLRLQIGKDISAVEAILSSILAAEKGASYKSAAESVALLPYAREQIAPQLEEGYPIRLYNETGGDTAFFDPFLVGVLLKNFVSNAVRYGNGKPIAVLFERVQYRPNALRMSVQDQGIGIAAEQLPDLTEPFWRADESRTRATGGYGLGLYLCRAIAQSLGSAIEIESRLGHGTRISVVIPQG